MKYHFHCESHTKSHMVKTKVLPQILPPVPPLPPSDQTEENWRRLPAGGRSQQKRGNLTIEGSDVLNRPYFPVI